MERSKKILFIGGAFEAAILIFALVLSIIVWTTIVDGKEMSKAAWEAANIEKNGSFIGFFQNNTTAFFCIVCIPIFILVALDFVYFAVVASKRESNLSDKQLAMIKKKAEEEVRAELMKEMEDELLNDDKKDE